MRYALTRSDYERLCCGDGLRLGYPKSTSEAVQELGDRGLGGLGPAQLAYLMRTGVIQKPSQEGRNLEWHEADIDRLAFFVDRDDDSYTWEASACAELGVLFAQFLQAKEDARKTWPEIDSDLLVMSIYPYSYDPSAIEENDYELSPYNQVLYHLDEDLLERLSTQPGSIGSVVSTCLDRFRARLRSEAADSKPPKCPPRSKAAAKRPTAKSDKPRKQNSKKK